MKAVAHNYYEYVAEDLNSAIRITDAVRVSSRCSHARAIQAAFQSFVDWVNHTIGPGEIEPLHDLIDNPYLSKRVTAHIEYWKARALVTETALRDLGRRPRS